MRNSCNLKYIEILLLAGVHLGPNSNNTPVGQDGCLSTVRNPLVGALQAVALVSSLSGVRLTALHGLLVLTKTRMHAASCCM